MANCCSLVLRYEFKDSGQADEFFDKLMKNKADADKSGSAFFIGSNDRYMFDGELTKDGTDVRVCGWTKWCVQPWDAAYIVQYAGDGLSSMRIEYDEPGDLQFGRYTWDGSTLTDRYLTSEHWPEMPEGLSKDAEDEWYDNMPEMLDAALGEFGETSSGTLEEAFAEKVRWDKSIESLVNNVNKITAKVDEKAVDFVSGGSLR